MKIISTDKMNSFLRTLMFMLLLLAPGIVRAQEFEAAPTSKLTGIALTNSAQRIIDKDTLAQFTAQLKALAARMQQPCVNAEVLAWAGNGYKRAEANNITQDVVGQMKNSGFVYEEQEAPEQQGSSIRIVAARKQTQTVTGFWIISDQVLMLAWCQLEQTVAAPAAKKTASSPGDSGQTVASQSGRTEENSPQQILVPGSPALTQQMVSRFSTFVEWLLDAPLTDDQRERIGDALKEDWKSQKATEIKDDMDMLDLEASLANRPAEEREYQRQQLREQILKEARLKKDDKNLQWLLAIYEAAHQPIASGNPPLTRQAADAFAELFGFMVAQVSGVDAIEMSSEMKDAFAQGIAQGYPKLNVEEKKALSGMPTYWAGLRVAWSGATQLERDKLRAQWREQLRAILSPAQFVQLEGAKAFQELSVWIEKAERGEVKRDELPRIATAMTKAATSLREAGGDQNQTLANRLTEMAKQVNDAAQARSAPVTATTNSLKTSLNTNHSLYSSIMSRSMVSHYALMGAISRIH